LMALERMKHCESVSALAEELGIHRTVLYHLKNHLKAMEGGAADSPGNKGAYALRHVEGNTAHIEEAVVTCCAADWPRKTE
jgi:hypothetical protein